MPTDRARDAFQLLGSRSVGSKRRSSKIRSPHQVAQVRKASGEAFVCRGIGANVTNLLTQIVRSAERLCLEIQSAAEVSSAEVASKITAKVATTEVEVSSAEVSSAEVAAKIRLG